MISLENVSYTYPNGNRAIDGVSLKIEGRTFVGGRTASGKTTLLRILSGLIPEFYGGELEGIVRREKKTYFVPQGEHVVSTTVAYEMALPLLHSGMDWDEALRRCRSIAKKCGIEDIFWEKTWRLSDGQKRIVAIASALASGRIPVMDEPFANLHPDVAKRIVSLLDVCVISEHRLEFMDMFDDVIWLERGRVSEVPKLDRECEFDGDVGEKMIEVDSVTFGFDRKLFEDVSFEVREGEVVALVGRNGCGKTTLLRIVAGFLRPWSGEVVVKGRVGLVFAFPNYHLFERRVEEEVSKDMLKTFGLERLKDRHPHTLSFGEAKRVAIAKAFERDVVLLDEPTAGQDWTFACELLRLSKELNKAVLVATHDLEFARLCDDIVRL